MATKNDLLIIKDDKVSFVNDAYHGIVNQYSNLNLNETYKYSNTNSTFSKPKSDVIFNQSDTHSHGTSKPTPQLSSAYFNTSKPTSHIKPWKKAAANDAKSSTLSLHITAYEHSIEAKSGDKEKVKTLYSSKEAKRWKLLSSTTLSESATKGCFEIPRQQRDQINVPELMSFKRSQRIVNPNVAQERRIPRIKRLQLAQALSEGEKITPAAKRLKMSTSGARYARDRMYELNELGNRQISRRVFSDQQTNSLILEQMASNRKIKTKDLHKILIQRGSTISVHKLRYRINALGFKWRKMHRVQVISKQNQSKRLNARAYWEAEDYPFHRYLFVDEATVNLGRTQQWCWVQNGERVPCQGRVRHGDGYHVFAGISWYGATKLQIWRSKHRMNSAFYCSNNLKDVVYEAKSLFPGGEFELAQDNHAAHTSYYTLNYLKELGIPTFDWPPQSPDFNPIEFIWRDLKEFIADRLPSSLDELHETIREFWGTVVTPAHCRLAIKLAIKNVQKSFEGLNHENASPRENVYQK